VNVHRRFPARSATTPMLTTGYQHLVQLNCVPFVAVSVCTLILFASATSVTPLVDHSDRPRRWEAGAPPALRKAAGADSLAGCMPRALARVVLPAM
jgi:hypothetical protein